jgi:diacylglycerol kinase (ATP)
MKHIFIINPYSGTHTGVSLVPIIEDYFTNHPADYIIHQTLYHKHAYELAQKYSEEDVTFYVIGGDGTTNEVLNGMSSRHTLAIIPSGTGNDFYRMLQIPKMSVEQLVAQTVEGKVVTVDYGMANQLRFINCFSMGFDADIGIMADRLKKKYPVLTPFVYGIATFSMLLKRQNRPLTLDFGTRRLETNSLMVAVMNGQFYGGGFAPTPMASIQDGELDVCVVENTFLLNVLRLLPKYMKGTHIKERVVRFYKIKQMSLEGEFEMNAQTDGEGMVTQKIEFAIVSKGLKLRVPLASKLKVEA